MQLFLCTLLTLLFWSAGIFGLFNFSAVVAEVSAIGLPYARWTAAATIALQLGGLLLAAYYLKRA
ncbi:MULTISPECIES: hypothetical protein [unclassified Janthinobacterium]|uniref:hypothetical protein n=1 Tax=unclassified Janthinobacterium TaxID=2610881 RepID=UPI00160C6B27|nr:MULTISPECIES: hypothetical protein [unclassified Janthinobacterium]MBB5607404.1 putative membrane protein YphA (DoxX/SURF4 family) [Janthinobacterium sp. S3T4]MBB5612425.1 putative membrane protein YphA (DoxX/SURF4 family) [Janthinobacterium sp. S3M3]